VGVARPLVADAGSGHADYLVLRSSNGMTVDGDRGYAVAASLYARRVAPRILLLERKEAEAANIGAVPSFLETGRAQLARHGIPDSSIVGLRARARNRPEELQALGRWLAERPGARVQLICGRFGSRSWRCVIDRVLDERAAARVELLGLPNRNFDESNWWRSYRGVKALVIGYIRLGHAVLIERRTEDGERRTENGERRTEDGDLTSDL